MINYFKWSKMAFFELCHPKKKNNNNNNNINKKKLTSASAAVKYVVTTLSLYELTHFCMIFTKWSILCEKVLRCQTH